MLEYWEKYIDLKIGKKILNFIKNLSKNNIWHDVFIPCDFNVKRKYAHSSGVYIQKKWDEKNLSLYLVLMIMIKKIMLFYQRLE